MRMRLRLRRGETYRRRGGDGEMLTILHELESDKKMMKVILPSGFTDVVAKADLEVPEIDTKDYERLK